jgi:phage terminase large subunit-like protein
LVDRLSKLGNRIAARQSLIPAGLPIDADRAAKAVRIFGRLRLVDVPGKPRMRDACEPWVFDFVRTIFGAQDPETRRQLIREFFVCVAKKNGKSSFAAGIMLTALIMNERAQGEYLILAPTKDVADNSFLPAYGMVKADEALFKRYKPSDSTREIVDRLDGSVLAVKSADADVVGGQKAIAIFVDELWLFGKKSAAENILSEATGSLAARPEGFVIYASTQSDDQPAGVFKKKLHYYRAVRDGEISDRASLPLIYEYPAEMQKAEAWRDASTWHIPNPSLSRSVDPEWLRQKLTEKEHEGRDSLQLFLAKHFNIEVGIGFRSDRWAGVEFWQRQADKTLTFEEILRRCEVVVIGIDGGGLDDLFGLTILGREKAETVVDAIEDGNHVKKRIKRWLSWSHAWCHRGVLERRKSIASVLQGFADADSPDLTIVDDELGDISGIIEYIGRVKDAGLLYCVAVDPAGLGEMVDALAEIDITQENNTQDCNFVVGVKQGYALMNAIKTAERKLANGTLLHADQPIMDWCAGNVKIEQLPTAIRFTKQNAGDAKVDPVAALFDAVQVMSTNPEAVGSFGPDYQMPVWG